MKPELNWPYFQRCLKMLTGFHTHLFGFLGLISTGALGAGISIGNISTHISSLP